MKNLNRQYLFASLFFGFGVYQAIIGDWWEFALYGAAGLAFAFNALTFEPKLYNYKKPFVVITWILIIGTTILFLWMLQFKYLA